MTCDDFLLINLDGDMEDLASAVGLLNRWARSRFFFSLSAGYAVPFLALNSPPPLLPFPHAQSNTAFAKSATHRSAAVPRGHKSAPPSVGGAPQAQITAPRLFASCPTTRISTSPRYQKPFLSCALQNWPFHISHRQLMCSVFIFPGHLLFLQQHAPHHEDLQFFLRCWRRLRGHCGWAAQPILVLPRKVRNSHKT